MKSIFFIFLAALCCWTNSYAGLVDGRDEPKNSLNAECSKSFSGSIVQIEGCQLCAKKPSDINSNSFNSCMDSVQDQNRIKYHLEDVIEEPSKIKKVKK